MQIIGLLKLTKITIVIIVNTNPDKYPQSKPLLLSFQILRKSVAIVGLKQLKNNSSILNIEDIKVIKPDWKISRRKLQFYSTENYL